MRRPTVLVPLDRTMQLPLTLAGGLQTTFADVVSSPLPGRLAALVRRFQADRNERSGEERKWGNRNRNNVEDDAETSLEGRERTVGRKSRWQQTTHTAQRHGSAYRSRSA